MSEDKAANSRDGGSIVPALPAWRDIVLSTCYRVTQDDGHISWNKLYQFELDEIWVILRISLVTFDHGDKAAYYESEQ